MQASRSFAETIRELIELDPALAPGLLMMALEFVVQGDLQEAKSVLRDYINATIGFIALGEALSRSPKSLMRMLSANGNPQLSNFLEITSYLQKKAAIKARLTFELVGKKRKTA